MELKTNTATRIAVGPLVDPTDGKTAELALTVTDLSVQIYQIKNDGSAVVRTQFAPTASGGNNDMVHVTDDTAGVYDLELTAAQLNFLGNGRITFYDVDGFLVHWIDILVVSAAYFDWKYGSTIPDVNVTKIGGTTQTAKDLGALEVTNINTLAGHDPGATLVKVADLGTVQTGDAFARLGAPTGASISADVAAVKAETAAILTDTNELQTDLVNGGRLDLLIDAIKAKTDNLPATPANEATLTTIAGYLDTEIAAILADTNELQTDWANGGRLDLILDAASAPTAAAVADAVWDEAISGHLGAGSTGNALNAAGSAGDPWSTPIPGAYGAGTAGKIIGDNINAPIGTVDTVVDAIKAKTDNLPASPAAVGSEMTLTAAYDAAKTAATQASVNTIDDFLDTEVAAILADTNELQTDLANGGRLDLLIDAIKAKTDNLPTDPADQSAVEAAITAATSPLATAAALDAVDNYVDTEVTAIKAVTDKLDTALELDGAVYRLTTNALEQAPTGGGSAPTAAEVADAVWDEVLDTAHEVAGSASVLLQASGAAGDPMSVAVPGSYAEGTAGYVIGHLESSGSGSVYWPYTVTDSATGNPIEGVTVSVSTDIAGSVVVASGTTNASGVVNFNLDPGTYYLWLSKTGYSFSNPDTEVVA